jgi:molybdate transport system permease protein
MNWTALALSLKLAAIVSFSLLIISLPLAWWLAASRRRWKFLVEAVVALPIVLPPTVIGFYLLVLMGPHGALGRWWTQIAGHPLAFTFSGLVIGSVIYSLPFCVQPIAASFAGIDASLLAASATLGASRWRTFWQVVMPLSLPGIVTGAVLSFAHTIGEFGVVLMIGGSIPGATQTISIAIYDDVQALAYGSANQAALLLLAISFVALAFVYGYSRRGNNLRSSSPWLLR